MLIGYHGDLGPSYGSVVRVFPNGQPFDVSDTPANVVKDVQAACAPVYAAGQTPFFSVKPKVSDLLAGSLDAHLTAVAQWCAQQSRKPYMTVWHEPENDMTGAQFVQVYSHAAGILRPAALMGPVNMAYQWQAGVGGLKVTDPADWVIPNGIKDFHGADFYSHTSIAGGNGTLAQHKAWDRWRNHVGNDALIFIVERGTDVPDTDQAQIMAADVELLDSIHAYGYLYWDVNTTGHPYALGALGMAQLAWEAQNENVQIVSPPATYTQAELDAAVAAADQAGYQRGRTDQLAEDGPTITSARVAGAQAMRDLIVASINNALPPVITS